MHNLDRGESPKSRVRLSLLKIKMNILNSIKVCCRDLCDERRDEEREAWWRPQPPFNRFLRRI